MRHRFLWKQLSTHSIVFVPLRRNCRLPHFKLTTYMKNYCIFLSFLLFISSLPHASPVCTKVLQSSTSPSPDSSSDENYRVSCVVGKRAAGDSAPNVSRHYADLNREQSIAVTVCYAFMPENTTAVYYGLDFLIPTGAVPDWCNNEDGCKTEQRSVY